VIASAFGSAFLALRRARKLKAMRQTSARRGFRFCNIHGFSLEAAVAQAVISAAMATRAAEESPLNAYLRELQRKFASGIAREQTHRSALEHLLELLDNCIDVFNNPKHIEVNTLHFSFLHGLDVRPWRSSIED
jgi:hypothetical protein